MKLYSRPLSPYSAFVRAVAYLKDVPVKLITLPYPIPDDFGDITPLKRLPVLITGSGETLFEAAVIAEYIDERFPETPLMPEKARERALVRLMARVGEIEVLTPAMKLFIMLSQTHHDAAKVEKLRATLDRGLAIIEARLDDGPYATGAQPTLADAWLLPVRFIMEPLKKLTGDADLLAAYPKFDAYAQNARQNPALELIWDEMSDGLKAFKPELA